MMMNAKRSNIHAGWKYFVLIALLAVLVSGLNNPAAKGKSVQSKIANKAKSNAKYGPLDPKVESAYAEMAKHAVYQERFINAYKAEDIAAVNELEKELAKANFNYAPEAVRQFETVNKQLDKYPFIKKEMLATHLALKNMGKYVENMEYYFGEPQKLSPESVSKIYKYMEAKLWDNYYEAKLGGAKDQKSVGTRVEKSGMVYPGYRDAELDRQFAELMKHAVYIKIVFKSPRMGTNDINIDLKEMEQTLTLNKVKYSSATEKQIDSVHTEFEDYPLFKREYVLWTKKLHKIGMYMISPEYLDKLSKLSPEQRKEYDAYIKSLEDNMN